MSNNPIKQILSSSNGKPTSALSDLAKAALELQRRNMDALSLYRITPQQEKIIQESADVRSFLLKGGNRSGKSHTAAIRFASIVRNIPLTTMDGRKIICRAPHQQGRDLLTWLIGLQLDHIGQTLHRLLFRPGMFDIVRDPKTGMWRAWHPPMHPDDFDIPLNERKPGPPLIPASEVEDWSWEKKSERQFSMCKLKNKTEIYAFASSAPVKAGDPVDEIWVDEEIKFANHYAEWQARLVDRSGRFFWSSWPSTMNSALLRLNKQADREAQEVKDGTREYATAKKATLKMSENPFFTKKQVEDTLSGYTEAERRARDQGEFVTDLIKLYGEFDEEIHRADYESDHLDDELSRVLRKNNWVPPRDWTRDLILDPGTAHPAVLMVAIPPPNFWEENEPYYVPYREIYIPRLTADDVAKEVKKTEQGFLFERFFIDGQASRQTPMGFSGTIGQNYSRAFARLNLSSAQFPVRSLMRIRPCGRPQLRIIKSRCPNLVEQLRDTVRKVVNDEKREVPETGQPIDVMVCLEYHSSRYPDFVWPSSAPQQMSPADMSLEYERKYLADKSGSKNNSVYFGAAS